MIAAVKLPNINPIIKIDMVFLTFFAASITTDKTVKEPILAASANSIFENANPMILPEKTEIPNTKIATPKLAPELMPNTKGPAKGFLNNVCISRPQIDNPEPTNMAVIVFGSLECKIIYCQDSLVALLPVSVCNIDLKGISTEPKLRFISMNSSNNMPIRMNFNEYVVLLFKN